MLISKKVVQVLVWCDGAVCQQSSSWGMLVEIVIFLASSYEFQSVHKWKNCNSPYLQYILLLGTDCSSPKKFKWRGSRLTHLLFTQTLAVLNQSCITTWDMKGKRAVWALQFPPVFDWCWLSLKQSTLVSYTIISMSATACLQLLTSFATWTLVLSISKCEFCWMQSIMPSLWVDKWLALWILPNETVRFPGRANR